MKQLKLKPVDMTVSIMKSMESMGLIRMLTPANHSAEAKEGETAVVELYRSSPQAGPHKLISVSVRRNTLPGFGIHNENEEFLLIGDDTQNPLFLVVAVCSQETLEAKAREKLLSSEDFICLRLTYNDPELSFFIMNKNVPHGECTASNSAPGSTFYVTESSDISLDTTQFGDVKLVVDLT
ncbi:MAG: hypothetical protein B6241_06780 [Spirochaetaceae bacterium 4572_59]|nr:MAG: hypothetical protein B6241_06780 [Spirochaetaceae bacterium 4572_59]